MTSKWLSSNTSDETLVHLKVKPGAHKNQILSIEDDRLVISLRAKAQDGQANTALQVFLADILNIAKSKIQLIKGDCAKFKTLKIRLNAKIINDIINQQLPTGKTL